MTAFRISRLRNVFLALSLAPLAAYAQTPAPALPAQQQQPDSSEPLTTIKAGITEVNLIFTVTDSHGRFVTGLRRENFGLLDDGKRPDRVYHFTQQTNLPLRVGVMLDTSASIRGRFKFEQEAASEFLVQVLHKNDRAFVEGFDIKIEMAQDYTNNIAFLTAGIDKLRPGGGTALFDNLYITCRDQMLTLKDEGNVRRALVLVSDGDDDYSRASKTDAIKMCQRAETIVYTISTNVSLSKGKGDDVLKDIAAATGGTPFYPKRIEDVAVGFHNIEEELRSQYSLEYKPSDFKADGSFRTIYLQALDRHYNVRARTGYFAPKAE
ncbi:VWFA-related domain-containing protein [Granulicella pectinivorans]|uniref:VWFA-related domain-containing protein n=1 Tax=Granulicella pectinivorans TaxID=474950 RepID=A0A1I6LRV6_9BACT|nr:VWA domain-containing protein [Granulicella pectinivorans]SFS06178.1 VWFA-related domain-containing protein [Granulicella pectinivorans]